MSCSLGSVVRIGLLNWQEPRKHATKPMWPWTIIVLGRIDLYCPRESCKRVNIHLELEERLAQYMQMEEAVVYSYGFSAITSAIPAYCQHKDLVFVDEKSISFGTLGKTGHGSLEWVVDGFCVGSLLTIEHQRLSGLGYCFSASFIQSMDLWSAIPQYHTFLLAFVVFWIAWFFTKSRYQADRAVVISDEQERKLEEWRPEPLISDVQNDHSSLNPKKITSRVGKTITVDGRECLNLGTHNYLGLTDNNEIEQKAIETIRKYGVGSCGPRGFYGTVDVHLELKERLAQFMQKEEAVVYSYGFSAIASAIPAYCKRKDLVFVDEKVNFSIQKGLDASRSNIKYFKHNDVEDLERLIKAQKGLNTKNSKNVEMTRKFLIVEGIYMNTGTICPLSELVTLARKYKLRIFVDESISFGTLGKTGHGITEHFDVPRHEIDMIMGSLEWAVSSVGGFCVGSSFIIEHQRLSGLGYCFSASLPPLLTSAAITSLDIMENQPELFEKLRENCLLFDKGVKSMESFECPSAALSPVKHLYLKNVSDYNTEQNILEKISNECLENKLTVIIPAYLDSEREYPRPSLRICISAALNQSEINFALSTLKKCVKEISLY